MTYILKFKDSISKVNRHIIYILCHLEDRPESSGLNYFSISYYLVVSVTT